MEFKHDCVNVKHKMHIIGMDDHRLTMIDIVEAIEYVMKWRSTCYTSEKKRSIF